VRLGREVRGELGDVDTALARFAEVSAEHELAPRSGAWFMLHDLEERRDALLKELGRVEAGEVLVVLDGAAVVQHSVDVDQFVRTLAPFQRSVSAIGQALSGGPTSQGTVAGITIDRTAMRLVDVVPGSFAAALTGPAIVEEEQLELGDEPDARSLFQQSIERLFDVLSASQRLEGFEDAILDEVAELGTRVTKHVDDLAQAAARNDAPTAFIWRAPQRPERRLSLAQGEATRLHDVVTALESAESEPFDITGTLKAGDLLAHSFKIVADDAEGTIYSGRMAPAIADRMVADFFDKPCTATLRALVTRNTVSGKETTRYVLERFTGPLDA
jgi:hypothetical protein